MTAQEIQQRVVAMLVDVFLSDDEAVDVKAKLSELGMDEHMIKEALSDLEFEYGVEIAFSEGMTIADIVKQIEEGQ